MRSVPAMLSAQGFSCELLQWCSAAPGLLRGRPLGGLEQLLFSHSVALNETDGTRHSSGSPMGSLGVTQGCFHPQAIMAAI